MISLLSISSTAFKRIKYVLLIYGFHNTCCGQLDGSILLRGRDYKGEEKKMRELRGEGKNLSYQEKLE